MLPFDERMIRVSRKQYLPSHHRGIQVPKEPTTIGGHLRKRRLELNIHQLEAARLLKVSTVTLSRWECDKVYPAWEHQPTIAAFLGFDPFTKPELGAPKSNEPQSVAFLGSDEPQNLGILLLQLCVQMRKTRKEFASLIGIDAKTISNWAANRRQPSSKTRERILKLLADEGLR